MAQVIFYGKPGCAGNRRQLLALREAGHAVEVRDLLAEPWTAPALGAFLAEHVPADWFNRSAPRVKSGEIVPERLEAEAALALLLADPLLIRRPLLQVGETRRLGWDSAVVDRWIGLRPNGIKAGEACPRDSE